MKIKLLSYWVIKLLIVFVVLVSIGSITTQRAVAQRTITISPSTIKQNLDPGQTIIGTIGITNGSLTPINFKTSIQDYAVFDTNGTPNLLPSNYPDKKHSASSWLIITPDTFAVLPHEKGILNYYLQVPLDARPGGHYAAVTFTPYDKASSESGAIVQERIAALFYISINGEIEEQARVNIFSTDQFFEYGPIQIKTQIKNLGDLHIVPEGKIIISDLLGRTIQENELSKFNIFPLSARDYTNTIGQKLMIGRFKATLLASYGENNNLPITAALYFWVIPWKLAILAILSLIIVVLGTIYLKRRKPTLTPKI
ncbi:MAG: hypothetical protein ABIC96_04130 [Patescibacteria group bacterium]